ncbi:uncharacterized protein I303_101022 [Kwoniella dejecticola CBS 10117]|uniref:D-isomer specific 2-hydroxyacid dehydrogenase NAD-binding domain-containing protein n=1 Tax=Kwoniella dejecticola CBS 10117 TaxID=1296121 RepID=A0AAJ8KHI8_9TREE
MSKILITRHVGDHAMNILKSSGLELIVNPEDAAPSRQWVLKHLADPDVGAACIMHSQPSDKVDEEFVNTCNANLKCVSTFSVGYVADITVMLVLMTLRKVGYGIDLIKRGDTEPANIIYNSSRRRDNQDQIDADFSQKYGIQVRRVEKDQLASQADILIVLCDLNPSTKDLVNKDFLAKMKPSSILVNVARAGQIFGAGLDVITGEPNIKPDHPLLHLDNSMKGEPLLAEVKA